MLIKADQNHYYVFRGDIGLPMGLIPLSQIIRRMIWQGRKFEEALEVGGLISQNQSDLEGLDEFSSHEELAIRYSKFNSYYCPFVSTTTKIRQALLYATDFGKDYEKGYLSIIRIKPERSVDYFQHVNYGVVAENKECAVLGYINQNEIAAQIPIKEIAGHIPKDDFSRDDLFTKYKDFFLSAEFNFNPLPLYSLRCPKCSGELYKYLEECLGTNIDEIKVYAVRKKKTSTSRSKEPQISQRAKDGFHEFSFQGMMACCMHCGAYMCNPKKLNERPATVERYWKFGEELFVEIKNHSKKTIDVITILVLLKENGKKRAWSFQPSLKDTSLVDLEFIRRGYPVPKWDYTIKPLSTGTCRDKSPEYLKSQVEDARIKWIHFENGTTWLSLSDWNLTEFSTLE